MLGSCFRDRTTITDLDETLLRELCTTPPPEFVAARNALAKQLRTDKRPEDAAAVAALRRPGWDDWSLNTVASSDVDAVGAFVDAATAGRDAQAAAIEGRHGADVRAVLRDLRERSALLVRLAEAALGSVGRRAASGEVNARLAQVAMSDVAVGQLRAGILGSGDAEAQEPFGNLEPASHPRHATAAKEPTPKAQRAAPAQEERLAGEQRKVALAAATREHRDAETASRRANAAVANAETARARAQAELTDADAALDAAREAATMADAAVDTTQRAVEALGGRAPFSKR